MARIEILYGTGEDQFAVSYDEQQMKSMQLRPGSRAVSLEWSQNSEQQKLTLLALAINITFQSNDGSFTIYNLSDALRIRYLPT